MKSVFFLLIIILVLGGCMSPNAISKNNKDIIYFDGTNKEEALSIAKEYCLKTDECKKTCNISSIRIAENEKWYSGQWLVSFKSRQLSTLDHRFFIFIDKKTGKIIGTEWMK